MFYMDFLQVYITMLLYMFNIWDDMKIKHGLLVQQ